MDEEPLRSQAPSPLFGVGSKAEVFMIDHLIYSPLDAEKYKAVHFFSCVGR